MWAWKKLFGYVGFALYLLVPLFTFPQDLIDRIENYLDVRVPEMLHSEKVPGMVIAVVVNEDVVLRGFGVASLDRDIRMDPRSTCVAVASISKLITALAILQLYETDKLQLDVDIQMYSLGFKLRNTFSSFITIHHLLTHTAGFDDQFLGMGAPTLEQVLPLQKYLGQYLPSVVIPPGSAISYSNHGFALLGYLVEIISGMKFTDYVDLQIFRPLEMNHTRFDGMCMDETYRAEGYLEYLGKIHLTRLDFAQTVPASSLHTTAEDFSHFLIAMLNQGRFKDKRILSPETIDVFLTPRYKVHPQLPGYACAWEEWFINGKRVMSHSGLTWGFSSLTFILPEEKLGVFVTVNTNRNNIIYQLANELINKFTLPVFKSSSFCKHRSLVSPDFYNKVKGFYRFNRYCRSDVFKLATFLPGFVTEVYVNGNYLERKIELQYLTLGSTKWFVSELGNMLWGREEKGGFIASAPRITFVPNKSWDSFNLVIGTNMYEPINIIESKVGQYSIFLGSITTLIICTFRSLFILLSRCFLVTYSERSKSVVYRTLFLSALFLFYIMIFAFYLFFMMDIQSLGYGIPLGLFSLLYVSYILLIITLLNWVYFIQIKNFSLDKFYMFLTIIACSLLLYLFWYWNVLDFRGSFLNKLYMI